MDNIKKLKDIILELNEVTEVEHIKSITSSVTTSWGEEIWDHEKISRDILQNARDGVVSAKMDIDQIKISTDNDLIKVYAPNEYSLEKLYYIGSSKTEQENQIGAHGEGVKKCLSDMTRMGIYNPIMISGDQCLVVSVGKEVPGTDGLRALVYNYFKINKLKGNYFIINTLDKKLKKAFQFGLRNFFYSSNPLIGEVLHSYNDITIYKSKNKDGFGFYKGLKRVDIKGIPVIISIDKKYAALEKKVKIDRDRQAFDSKLQSTFYSIFARSGFYYASMENNHAIKYILESSKEIWPKGHLLLSALASATYGRLKEDKSLKNLFGNEYLSESTYTYSRDVSYNDWFSTKTQNYIRSRDNKMKKNNKIMLPSYFNNFGVMSSLESFIKAKVNAEKRIKNKKTADLTTKEQEAIKFCFEAAKGVSPSFAKLFNNEYDEDESLYNLKFKKIFCKELLGEIKNNSDYNSKTVYLHADLFKQSFGKMFSTFLHELSHATGNDDGSREFSDCLTYLISACIDNNAVVSKYSKQWNKFIN